MRSGNPYIFEMNTPLLSVIVCTYNRADILPVCLRSLAGQTLAKSLYEVIVVDNNSNDATRQIAQFYVAHAENFSLLVEEASGLSLARNRGWREARGEYVAFVDDDCKMPPQWARVARDVIQHVRPAVFGGSSFAFYNSPKPSWYKDSYLLHDFGEYARALSVNEHLDGMNMCFRRDVFEVVGGFDSTLGMTGRTIAYGEETELMSRVRMMMPGEIIYYHPDFFVYHLVRAEKMNLRREMMVRFANGRYSRRLFGAPSQFSGFNLFTQLARTLYYLLLDLLRAFFTRDRAQYPYAQNYLYERAFQHLRSLGELYEQYAQLSKR